MERKRICDPELSRAFFKYQRFTDRFSPMEALDRGTVFPELYCPYKYKDKYDYEHDTFRRRGRPYGYR